MSNLRETQEYKFHLWPKINILLNQINWQTWILTTCAPLPSKLGNKDLYGIKFRKNNLQNLIGMIR